MGLQLGVVSSREERRQSAVAALGLGERVREERFDRITRLACAVLGAPASTITVLDEDRACYPGAAGYDGSPVPREQTFCDRTTDDDAFTLVTDARLDPRFAGLDAVVNGDVRFYVGVPLHDRLGNVIGVLCVFDAVARTITTGERRSLEDLAHWAEQELTESAEEQAATAVQASLMPDRPLHTEGWDVAGFCVPALAVGGDFFDYRLGEDVLHVGLGDVMGKGTGAALLGAGIRAAVRATHAEVVAGVDLGWTATRIARSQFTDLERTDAFATVFEAAIDVFDGTLRYVDAGLGLVLVTRADGSIERLHTTDRPFGILADDLWTEHRAWLEPGDRMLVFSDGLLDVLDEPMRWWEPLGRLLADSESAEEALERIGALARSGTCTDDVTALVVHRTGADPVRAVA
jgi:phosphoserine phosphatase RsbU/P